MTEDIADLLAGVRGDLVYAGDPVTPDWFATRRQGITATDVAAICVENPYRNARMVALDKWGELPDALASEETEAAFWGTRLEGPVADVWADRNRTTVHPVGILAAEDHPWQLASLDRLVGACPDGDGPCGLEVKTRSAFLQHQWREDVPDDVLAQVLWQMVVTGFEHMHVACLIGGQRMVQARINAADEVDVTAHLLREAERVWADVQAGSLPDAPYDDAMERLLEAQYGDADGEETALVPLLTAERLVADYQAGLAAEKAVTAQRKAARVRLLEALAGAGALAYPDADECPVAFVTHRPQARTTVPAAAVRDGHPELWKELDAAGLVTVTESRRLLVRATALPKTEN